MFQIELVQNIKTHILRSTTFFSENGAIYEIVEKHGIQDTSDNMAHALCMLITKTTNIHLEYVILIALPLQRWFHERASTLCLYIH
jgi:hypothetical protein